MNTEDLTSYIPGYEGWCAQIEEDAYDNGHLPGVDDIVDEILMERRERDIENTEWILVEDTPTYKKWVASGSTNFFRDERYDPNGNLIASSSWKE